MKDGIYLCTDLRSIDDDKRASVVVHAVWNPEDSSIGLTYTAGNYGTMLENVDFEDPGAVDNEDDGVVVVMTPQGRIELHRPTEELWDELHAHIEDLPEWPGVEGAQAYLSQFISLGML